MKRLIAPDDLGIDLYDKIIKCKHNPKKNLLNKIRPFIKERYEKYENCTQDLSLIKEEYQFSCLEKESLLSCYGDNANFNKAKKSIIARQVDAYQAKCPYCGISEPNTMDHYLPKGIFPEFSIFGLNLLPCCSKCNELKNEKWMKAGRRLILNFYFDDIPENDKFLYATLQFGPNIKDIVPIIDFYIKRSLNISPETFERINSHVKILNLVERFKIVVNDKYTTIFEEVSWNILNLQVDMAKTVLQNKTEILTKQYGKNYWGVALYDAIISSQEFFDRCKEHAALLQGY